MPTAPTSPMFLRARFGRPAVLFVVLTALLASATVPTAHGQDTEPATPTCDGRKATIIGTEGDDVLEGTPGADVIVGLGGDDSIMSGSGADRICGGGGDDTILAGRGKDRVWGEAGADTIDGGKGDDLVHGGEGDDIVLGSAGHDHVFGGPGNDELDAGRGADFLTGGTGDDVLKGGKNEDYMIGDEGDDLLDGGRSHDTLLGEEGDDTLLGGKGNDRLIGGIGQDSLEGGGGRDTLEGDAGDDRLEGGPGRDILNGGEGTDHCLGGPDRDKGFACATFAGIETPLFAAVVTFFGMDNCGRGLCRITVDYTDRSVAELGWNVTLRQTISGETYTVNFDGQNKSLGDFRFQFNIPKEWPQTAHQCITVDATQKDRKVRPLVSNQLCGQVLRGHWTPDP